MTRGASPKIAPADDAVAQARRALHMAIGERILEMRSSIGLGREECASGAGIDMSSMYRIRKGQQNQTAATFARIALSLGTSMEELLMGVHPDPAICAVRPRTWLSSA